MNTECLDQLYHVISVTRSSLITRTLAQTEVLSPTGEHRNIMTNCSSFFTVTPSVLVHYNTTTIESRPHWMHPGSETTTSNATIATYHWPYCKQIKNEAFLFYKRSINCASDTWDWTKKREHGDAMRRRERHERTSLKEHQRGHRVYLRKVKRTERSGEKAKAVLCFLIKRRWGERQR